MKNSNDTIGYRTRDPTTCSAVPQPNALPRAIFILTLCIFIISQNVCSLKLTEKLLMVSFIVVFNTARHMYTEWSFFRLELHYNIAVRICPIPRACHMAGPSYSHLFHQTSTIFPRSTNHETPHYTIFSNFLANFAPNPINDHHSDVTTEVKTFFLQVPLRSDFNL